MAANLVYGTSPVKRSRRTNAELEAIDEAIVNVLDEEHPATVRSVFYRVTSMGLVPKTENGYRLIIRQLLKLRRDGRVPYGHVSDGSRYVLGSGTQSSAEVALRSAARMYRRQVWETQPVRIMLFSEKDAIVGTIAEVARRWDVSLGVTRGYSSETQVHEIAMSLDETVTTFMYQLGDHDPSGVDAWRSFEHKVREFVPRADAVFQRIAVTPDQIDEMRLPTRPTKKTDSRSKSFVGGSVEVDAIAPSTLRQIVEDAIVKHIDWNAYETMQRLERQERLQLLELAGQWRELTTGEA